MVAVITTPDINLAGINLGITFTNTGVTACKIERLDPGMPWVIIKSGTSYPCTAGKASLTDFEVPFDVDVTYRVSQVTPAGAETVTTAAVRLNSWLPDGLTGPAAGYTWLKDPAYPSRSVRLDEVTSLPQLTYPARSGVFAVIDRPKPIGVSARRQSWTGDLTFTTATLGQRDRVNDLLARGQVLLLATPYGFGIGNVYLIVGDVQENRIEGAVVTEPSRSWTLPITCVDRPDSLTLAPLGMRWIDVKTKYATWAALAAATTVDGAPMTWDRLMEDTP